MELLFFHGATCAYKVQLVIAELNAPVALRRLTRDELVSDWYLAVNPKGIVPTMVDGDRCIIESTTIMRFVDDCAGSRLQPASAYDRATMNNWLKVMDEEVFPAMGYLTFALAMRDGLLQLGDDALERKFRRTSTSTAIMEKRLDAVRNGVGSAAFHDALDAYGTLLRKMEARLRGALWLAGDDYSLADAAITPALVRLAEFGFQEWWEKAHPSVDDWWSRIKRRPSYREVFEVDPNPDAGRFREAGQAAWPSLRPSIISKE